MNHFELNTVGFGVVVLINFYCRRHLIKDPDRMSYNIKTSLEQNSRSFCVWDLLVSFKG